MLITARVARLGQVRHDRANRPRHSVVSEKLLDRPHREALVVREMVACGDEEVAVISAELESRVGLGIEARDDRQGGTHSF
jgi:hypothetical protein